MSSPLSTTLTHLDINLGDLCNLRCVMCDSWLKSTPVHIPREMLIDRLHESLLFVEQHCTNFDKAMIIGGEPFVHGGLKEFLRLQRHDLYLTVYTNFTKLLDCQGWPDNVHFIVSLDAADVQTYIRIRGRDLFPVTQENFTANFKRVIHVDSTVSRANIHQLDSLLEITNRIGCTHWFLPIDPRIIRYQHKLDDGGLGGYIDESHRGCVGKTVASLSEILLTDEDLQQMESFFRRHQDLARINDFSMFKGLYLSGKRHFQDLDEYGQKKAQVMPKQSAEKCPALNGYMEVFFDNHEGYVPTLHCDELRRSVDRSPLPVFATFDELFDWESELRSQVRCESFCGRTQFLGIDSYKDIFSAIN